MGSMMKIDLKRNIRTLPTMMSTPEGRAILAIERKLRAELAETKKHVYNIASKEPHPLNWFIDPRVYNNPVSPAESMISGILDGYNMKYYREVSFYGLQLPTGGYPRYDWWVPDHMLIIEYDGKKAHETAEQKAKDELKNRFCKKHDIDIVRWNSSHYYKMDNTVDVLMKRYNIEKVL